MLIFIVWQSSRVDTSQMTYKSRRTSSIWKYSLIAIFGIILDLYLIVMSFAVSLSTLIRCLEINEQLKDEYLRNSSPAGLLDN